MKALAIIAVVFAGLSIFIPLVGIFLAMFCSVLALMTFRSQSTLSGITFGLNIISTAFLSPSLMVAEAFNSSKSSEVEVMSATTQIPSSTSGGIYLFYVGFHIALFFIAIAWRLMRGAPK